MNACMKMDGQTDRQNGHLVFGKRGNLSNIVEVSTLFLAPEICNITFLNVLTVYIC